MVSTVNVIEQIAEKFGKELGLAFKYAFLIDVQYFWLYWAVLALVSTFYVLSRIVIPRREAHTFQSKIVRYSTARVIAKLIIAMTIASVVGWYFFTNLFTNLHNATKLSIAAENAKFTLAVTYFALFAVLHILYLDKVWIDIREVYPDAKRLEDHYGDFLFAFATAVALPIFAVPAAFFIEYSWREVLPQAVSKFGPIGGTVLFGLAVLALLVVAAVPTFAILLIPIGTLAYSRTILGLVVIPAPALVIYLTIVYNAAPIVYLVQLLALLAISIYDIVHTRKAIELERWWVKYLKKLERWEEEFRKAKESYERTLRAIAHSIQELISRTESVGRRRRRRYVTDVL